MSGPTEPRLPAHYALTRAQLFFSGISIAVALLLFAAFGVRIATRLELWQWWVPLAFVGRNRGGRFRLRAGALERRHLGPRRPSGDRAPPARAFSRASSQSRRLSPPALHRDERRRRVCGGDPPSFLRGSTRHRLGRPRRGVRLRALRNRDDDESDSPVGAHAVAVRPIRLLQNCGLFLGRSEHAAHHERPYDASYCITTGWCNGPLEAIRFFRRLEAAITRLTGARPRHDDRR